MSNTPIKRYESDISQWSPEDFLRHTQTGAQPERQEWLDARARALRLAHLEDTDADSPVELADMTASDHFKRLRGQA